MREMPHLILMRHSQSAWNALNLFTGWVDVPLSKQGIDDAIKAGQDIADLQIDEIHTSLLIRAQMTAMIAMSEHESGKTPVIPHQGEGEHASWGNIYDEKAQENCIPVIVAWEINERMYGELRLAHQDPAPPPRR